LWSQRRAESTGDLQQSVEAEPGSAIEQAKAEFGETIREEGGQLAFESQTQAN
jgi:hypothetical protein